MRNLLGVLAFLCLLGWLVLSLCETQEMLLDEGPFYPGPAAEAPLAE
jgi:hypothetical protein